MSSDRKAAKLAAQLREQTGEETLLVYAASRVGAWSALIQTHLFAGLATATDSAIRPWAKAANAKIERREGKSTSLPTSFYVVVTARSLHFRKIRGFMVWTWLGPELGVLSRHDLQAFAFDTAITRRFGLVDREQAQAVAFEGFRRHHLTDEFTVLIGARVVDSPEELAKDRA